MFFKTGFLNCQVNKFSLCLDFSSPCKIFAGPIIFEKIYVCVLFEEIYVCV